MTLIRPGMTLAEISKSIPHTGMTISPVHTHGGRWYTLELPGDYSISFRVKHPRDGIAYDQCCINLAPSLENRKTRELLISGGEGVW